MREKACSLVDIRDPASFASGNIEGSVHISNDNVQQYLSDMDKEKPLIVVCYHGNSSQGAAEFFASQGCREVYSLDGGFVEWQQGD
jgi:thiosulfate sulfurtransferase